MDFANYWFSSGSGGGGGYQIGNSLRFRGSQYLTRTNVSNPTSTRTCTVSVWCKFALTNSTNNTLVSGENGLYTQLGFGGSNGFNTALGIQTAQNASVAGRWQQRGENRDPSAWMHVVMVYNSVSGGSNGIRIFKNGVEQPSAQYIDPNGTDQFLTVANTKMQVGGFQNTYLFQGCMAEVRLVDGQALTPTDFGEFNDDGVWVPIDYTGTYGNSGYYLDFSDPANIGADRSGNGNNFTPTNFELTDTTSTNYDWMADSPTANFGTVNPLARANVTLSNANLSYTTNNTNNAAYTTFPIPAGGRFYWEYDQTSGPHGIYGIAINGMRLTYNPADDAQGWGIMGHSGNSLHAGVQTPYAADTGVTGNFAIAFDANNGRLFYRKEGVWQGGGDPVTGANPFFDNLPQQTYMPFVGDTSVASFNGGQRPFKYAPPTGYTGLTTEGLEDVAITNPSDHFRTILDTGANILTNAQAQVPNGFYIIKDRVNANNFQLISSLVGTTQVNFCPSGSVGNYAAPTGNSIAWCWATDAAGLNTTAGFQMVQYTGNGGTQRINHSLGVTPDCIWVYPVSGSGNAQVFHRGMPNMNDWVIGLHLNQNASNLAGIGNGGPSATDFGVGNYGGVNANGQQFIALLWRQVPGYSFFGNSQSNNNADGPFVYYGMRPALAGLKATTNSPANSWNWASTGENPHNPVKTIYETNHTTATTGTAEWDMLSNGFKWRHAGGGTNASGQNIIHMAWAEHPFGGGNVSPSPAR